MKFKNILIYLFIVGQFGFALGMRKANPEDEIKYYFYGTQILQGTTYAKLSTTPCNQSEQNIHDKIWYKCYFLNPITPDGRINLYPRSSDGTWELFTTRERVSGPETEYGHEIEIGSDGMGSYSGTETWVNGRSGSGSGAGNGGSGGGNGGSGGGNGNIPSSRQFGYWGTEGNGRPADFSSDRMQCLSPGAAAFKSYSFFKDQYAGFKHRDDWIKEIQLVLASAGPGKRLDEIISSIQSSPEYMDCVAGNPEIGYAFDAAVREIKSRPIISDQSKVYTDGKTVSLQESASGRCFDLTPKIHTEKQMIPDFVRKDAGLHKALKDAQIPIEDIDPSKFEYIGVNSSGRDVYRSNTIHIRKQVHTKPWHWLEDHREDRDCVVDLIAYDDGYFQHDVKDLNRVNDSKIVKPTKVIFSSMPTDTPSGSGPGNRSSTVVGNGVVDGNSVITGDGKADAQDKSEHEQQLIQAGIPEDLAHIAAYDPDQIERIRQKNSDGFSVEVPVIPAVIADPDAQDKSEYEQRLIQAGIPEDIAHGAAYDPEQIERIRQRNLSSSSGEAPSTRSEGTAPQQLAETSHTAPQQPTVTERIKERVAEVVEMSKIPALETVKAAATSGVDKLLKYFFTSTPTMDGKHFFGKGPEATRYTPYLDKPILNLQTTLSPDVEMRDTPQDPESAADSAGAPELPIIFDDTARPLKIKRTGDFSSSPTAIDKPFVIHHSVVGMEGPAPTTQSGGLTPGQFKKFTKKTTSYNEVLSRITGSDATLKNTCGFVDMLNKFANLYAQTDGDDGSAYALRFAARYMVKYGQNTAKIFGNHAQGAVQGVSDSGLDHLEFGAQAMSNPPETLANIVNGLKELTIFTAKIMAIGEMSQENPELALDAFDREIKPVIQPLYDKLEAMTGPERTRFITRTFCNLFLAKHLSVGLQTASLGISIPTVQQFGLATDAAKEFYGALINEAEIANRIANFANLPAGIKSIKTPISTMYENLGKFGQIAQQKGQEFARKIAEALQRNPELVEIEGSFDGAVARLTGDLEGEGAPAATSAADDLGSFRRGDDGSQGAAAPVSTALPSTDKVTWVNYGKHVPQSKMPWKEIVKSTGNGGVARYCPDIGLDKASEIEKLERFVWETGVPVASDKPNKVWKIKKLDYICGACDGKETPYMRIEYSSGFIHGHPITEAEYMKLLKR